jgi:hypothetical protein
MRQSSFRGIYTLASLAVAALLTIGWSEKANAIELTPTCKKHYEKFEAWQQYYKVFAYGDGGGRSACAYRVGRREAIAACTKRLNLDGIRCQVYAESPVDGKTKVVWRNSNQDKKALQDELPNWIPKYSGRVTPLRASFKIKPVPGYKSECQFSRRAETNGNIQKTSFLNTVSVTETDFGAGYQSQFEYRSKFKGSAFAEINRNGEIGNRNIAIDKSSSNSEIGKSFEFVASLLLFDIGHVGKTVYQGGAFNNDETNRLFRGLQKLAFGTTKIEDLRQNFKVLGITEVNNRRQIVISGIANGSFEVKSITVNYQRGGFLLVDVHSGLVSKWQMISKASVPNKVVSEERENLTCDISGNRLAEILVDKKIEAEFTRERRTADDERKRLADIARKKRIETERKIQLSNAREKALASVRQKHRDAIAVIIGNKSYKGRTPEVTFAHNDADAMKQFVLDRLAYRDGNIIDLRDATRNELAEVFGNEKTHEGKLFDWIKPGKSDVLVFYSGHGVPGLKDRRPYLLPVDGNANRAEITGFPVDVLYKNLAKTPARSMTIYLDACFSGDSPRGMLVNATSGISINAKMPHTNSSMTVVTAAQGDQFASWDEEARMGLFTRHLIRALNGAADGEDFGNSDGQVSVEEVQAYLDDEMTYQARRTFGRRQRASVRGSGDTFLATVLASPAITTANPGAPQAIDSRVDGSRIESKKQVAAVANNRVTGPVSSTVHSVPSAGQRLENVSDRYLCINTITAFQLKPEYFRWAKSEKNFDQYHTEMKGRGIGLDDCRNMLKNLDQTEFVRTKIEGQAMFASKKMLCRKALNLDGSDWRGSNDSSYGFVIEAISRGIKLQGCQSQN